MSYWCGSQPWTFGRDTQTLLRTTSVRDRSPSIDAKRSRIFLQRPTLSLIEVLAAVCHRRVIFAWRKDPEGSAATVSVTLPCLRTATVSFGR